MKKFVSLMVLLAALFALGCRPQPKPPSQAELILGGEHKLRKMTERTDVSLEISGGFFLFGGHANGSVLSVKFAWEMNDGTYALSSLPLEKIRVKFDEQITSPTIKFRWRRYDGEVAPQTQNLMDYYVSYALITIRESDWPAQIELPLNSQ
jgi:hypothetical protein